MGGGPPIRDGGNLNSMGPPKSCGMDGESRSERSILHQNNRSPTSTVDLSCAPWTFTKVMKPIMDLSRAQGIQIIIYIHKRHADTGGVQEISCAALGSAHLSPRSSGLHY